jgi:hypothetical protein
METDCVQRVITLLEGLIQKHEMVAIEKMRQSLELRGKVLALEKELRPWRDVRKRWRAWSLASEASGLDGRVAQQNRDITPCQRALVGLGMSPSKTAPSIEVLKTLDNPFNRPMNKEAHELIYCLRKLQLEQDQICLAERLDTKQR